MKRYRKGDYQMVIERLSAPHNFWVRLCGQSPHFTVQVHCDLGPDYRRTDGAIQDFLFDIDFSCYVKPLDLIDAIARAWLEMRIHEAREEFKVDGEIWMHPHKTEGLGHFVTARNFDFGTDWPNFGDHSQGARAQ